MSKNKDQLREMFWDLFRSSKCRTGHMVPYRTYQSSIYDHLNPIEQDSIRQVIQELFEEGKIAWTPEGGLQGFVLTELGYDMIYKVRSNSQLEDEIMNRFPQNCKVGDIIRVPSLWIDLKKELNPKEYDKMVDIINGLIDKAYISYEKTPFECLRLEQTGFEYIYR